MALACTVPSCFGDNGLATTCPPTPLPGKLHHADVAAIARALAHPARLAIIGCFGDGRPKMTKELVAPSGLAASTMSEHLRILREAAVVVTHNDGTRIWYCLCGDRLREFGELIERLGQTSHKESDDSGPRTLPLFVE